MIVFPNAKINLGLRILRRRPDNYHEIATVMLPVDWCDILEIIPASNAESSFRLLGNELDCPPEKNIVLKAVRALESYLRRSLPPLDITLEKHIPSGAGMGGGSADAAFTLTALNSMFELGLTPQRLAEVAVKVGADCPFFIYNRPMYASGIGEKLTPIDASALNNLYLLIAKPEAEAVSTAAAYASVHPRELSEDEELTAGLAGVLSGECTLVNDFETSVMALRPQIRAVKDAMNQAGTLYTSMTGSGAAVFGFFPDKEKAERAIAFLPPTDCKVTGPLFF